MRLKIAVILIIISLAILIGAKDAFAKKIELPEPKSWFCRNVPIPTPRPKFTPAPVPTPSPRPPYTPEEVQPPSESPSEAPVVAEPPSNHTPRPIPTPNPRPEYVPTPTPKPSSVPEEEAPIKLPEVAPTPVPRPKPSGPVRPVPPSDLPPSGPEPTSTGSAILDEALEGKHPLSVLPLWHGYPWQKIEVPKAWTAELLEILRRDGQELVNSNPEDIALYCAKYSSLNEEQRLLFWLRFLSVLIEHESTFNPFKITFTKGVNVYSVGLLQLSLQSSQRSVYDCTMIKSYDDIFDWRKNLACGVRMLSYFMKVDQAISWNSRTESYPWRGLARYWEPLRDPRIRTELGRQCLTELVEQRRPYWIEEAGSTIHPSYFDGDYRQAGELRFERLLRLVNQFPYCN